MLNVELLERVKKHILEEPKRLDMDTWAAFFPEEQGGPACNTVGCIAGWTVLLGDNMTIADIMISVPFRAQQLLGIDFSSSVISEVTRSSVISEVAKSLFYTLKWPSDLQFHYTEAQVIGDQQKMAELTAKRIDLFIEEQLEKEKLTQNTISALAEELKKENNEHGT